MGRNVIELFFVSLYTEFLSDQREIFEVAFTNDENVEYQT